MENDVLWAGIRLFPACKLPAVHFFNFFFGGGGTVTPYKHQNRVNKIRNISTAHSLPRTPPPQGLSPFLELLDPMLMAFKSLMAMNLSRFQEPSEPLPITDYNHNLVLDVRFYIQVLDHIHTHAWGKDKILVRHLWG